MTLIVGLGNPTDKYKNNRHNIGFKVIDNLVDDLNATNVTKATFKGALYKSQNLFLLKPYTFMNLSGESVLAVSKYYKISRIIVIHDELDIDLGRIKMKTGGSSGGHNGLKSIDALVGQEYDRIRVGISRPIHKSDVTKHVLGDFSKEQLPCVEDIIQTVNQLSQKLAKSNIKDVLNTYPSKQNICN